MKLINFKHSIIFFNLCILISPFYILLDYEPIIICLFLILILGISHGALDDMKGKKLLKLLGYNSIKIFYSIYLIFSILIVIAWYIFPNALLSIFLIVAAYHFGKEDTVFSFKKRLVSEILFFLKGSPVIISPLLFQREATNEIFKLLNFNIFELPVFSDQLLIIFLILSFFSSIYISSSKNLDIKMIMIVDFLSLLILNFFLTPVLAFTIYFCFLHSIRHAITLIFELDNSFEKGLGKFAIRAIPLTIITMVIFLVAIYSLNNFFMLDEAIYKVIFIGLASLTFPHILLEYLLEKNEKRT
jgi:Brp/Blh family beta-carotene 15,15'-monooxygenase